MRKLLTVIVLCLCSFVGVQAQTIQDRNKFWDGEYLYVTEIQPNGNAWLKGMDISGHQQNLLLRKHGSKAGEYELIQGSPGELAPFGCMYGCRVQYVRQDGMNFLGFYVEEHTIGQTLVLTPDNIVNCVAQQKFAEEETDPLEQVSNWLMNQHYLHTVYPGDQQKMLDKLDQKKKMSIIERTNHQLLSYAPLAGLYAGVDVEECDEERASADDEDPSEFVVSTASEFLAALGSNRTVTIAEGAVLNLSEVLSDRDWVEGAGCQWRDEFYTEREMVKVELVVSSDVYDGRQLELVNIHDLTIRGTKDCYLIVEPRYADVLSLYGCRDVRIENLTLGHTYDGECAGGVINCENCLRVEVHGCDLYGCGITGLAAHECNDIVLESTIICDCSEGIMELHSSENSTFIDCDFVRCKDYSGIYIDEKCQSTKFIRCRFAENTGSLFSIHSEVSLESCEIHQPKGQSLGNVADGYIKYADDNTRWLRDADTLKPRNIGPKITN